jgi:hypothetical protein
MTPREPGPEAETRVLRVVLVVLGIGAGVFLLLTLGPLIADAAYFNPAWSIATAIVVFAVPPVLAAHSFVLSARALRRLLGGYAIAFTLAVALGPFMMSVRPMPLEEQPWPLTVTALGTTAAALAWRPWLAWSHLVLNCALIVPVRYVTAGGVDLALPLRDAFFTLSFVAIFTALALVALGSGRALDSAAETARMTAARSAATEAREREQARLDALVHDEVIATLYYASLGRPEVAASVRTQAARAVAQLARLREPDEGEGDSVPIAIFVSRMRSVVSGQDETIRLRVHATGTGTVPPEVAAAFAEATSEAVRNSLEHATRADTARSVVLAIEPHRITVEIRDSGPGFDPGQVPGHRLGIAVSIRGRLAAIGGVARVQSRPQGGTTVSLQWWRP